MKTTVLRWLTLVGVLLTLVMTIMAGINVNQQNIDYKEVEAQIISTHKQKVKRIYNYNVVVEYQGKKYDLLNVRNEEFSRYELYKGGFATVYLSDGKMYSNITGVKTSGNAFYIYLAALAGTIAFLILHIMFVKNSIKEKL